MIKVYCTPEGITSSIDVLIHLIQTYKSHFLKLIEFRGDLPRGGETYTFVAIFRESNSIGDFVAFVEQNGTNWGPDSGGEGSGGYARMRSFIEDKGIQVDEQRFGDLAADWGKRLLSYDHYVPSNIWAEYLQEMEMPGVILQLYRGSFYPENARWSQLDPRKPIRRRPIR